MYAHAAFGARWISALESSRFINKFRLSLCLDISSYCIPTKKEYCSFKELIFQPLTNSSVVPTQRVNGSDEALAKSLVLVYGVRRHGRAKLGPDWSLWLHLHVIATSGYTIKA